MGSSQSSEKLHCNRYLNGEGPPSLLHQAHQAEDGSGRGRSAAQPDGQMTWVVLHRDLPGFPDNNTLQINYNFPDGIQTEQHPHPGQPYSGLRLCTYLPDSREGRKVLRLLDRAFQQKQLFVVASGEGGAHLPSPLVPLKTQVDAHTADGYPDPDYLKTVRKLLKDKGIE